MQPVQEGAQGGGKLGAGFHGEAGFHLVRVGGQFAAGVLNDGVMGILRVLGHHADVGGDDVGFQHLGQIHDHLGTADQLGIQLGVGKAPAQVAAQGGNHQAVILHHVQEILALLAHQVFGGHFALGGVHLNALGPQLAGQLQGLREGLAEGIQYNTDGKSAHGENLLKWDDVPFSLLYRIFHCPARTKNAYYQKNICVQGLRMDYKIGFDGEKPAGRNVYGAPHVLFTRREPA